jgi:predicted ABC-type ATPase
MSKKVTCYCFQYMNLHKTIKLLNCDMIPMHIKSEDKDEVQIPLFNLIHFHYNVNFDQVHMLIHLEV